MSGKLDLEVIIPVKNEAEKLPGTVQSLHLVLTKARISYRLIIVDDNSTDHTVKVANSLSRSSPILLVRKTFPPGPAQSILEASRHATADFLTVFEPGSEYPPEYLPLLYRVALQSGVAIGNRSFPRQGLLDQISPSAIPRVLSRFLLGLNCDINSQFQVFRTEIIKHLESDAAANRLVLNTSLLRAALELGWQIESLDIPCRCQSASVFQRAVEVIITARQVFLSALQAKVAPPKTYLLKSPLDHVGHGLIYNRKKFITHSRLPVHLSALHTFTLRQKLFLAVLIALLLLGFAFNPLGAVIVLVSLVTLMYFLDVFFNLYLVIKSLRAPPELRFSATQINNLSDEELPRYTILCPLYKEAEILNQFVTNMQQIDWPKDKLEIFLLLEEDDRQTLLSAQNLNLPDYFRILIVPHSHPKTKPKACNYGLAHASGEYIVIYDAEDRPDPDQLKKAYLGFLNSPAKTVCLQAKLNYYNPNQNLLTRLFTAEYCLWFNVILPGLQSIGTTIPLGGTSNHFRTRILKSLHGWDAFNVTEDCDLGTRLFKSGYATAIIDSWTLEEANSNIFNWFRQRSRWLKGYMQTYLVHNRDPWKFLKNHGIHALLFQLIVGGKIAFIIINPLLWSLTLAYFLFRSSLGPVIETLFPRVIFYMAAISLVFGNFLVMYYYMIGAAKTGRWWLLKYVFLAPFYWLAISLAALKAVKQLIFAPHFWEKTHHGLHLNRLVSRFSRHPASTTRRRTNLIPQPGKFLPPAPAAYLATSSLIAAAINFLFSVWVSRTWGGAEFGVMLFLSHLLTLGQFLAGPLSLAVFPQTDNLSSTHPQLVKNSWKYYAHRSLPWSFFACGLWLALTPLLADFFPLHSLTPLLLTAPLWAILPNYLIDSFFLLKSRQYLTLGSILMVDNVVRFSSAVLLLSSGQVDLAYAAVSLGAITGFLLGRFALCRLKVANAPISPKQHLSFAAGPLNWLSTASFLKLDILLAYKYLPARLAGECVLLSTIGNTVFLVGLLFFRLIASIAFINLRSQPTPPTPTLLSALAAPLAGLVFLGVLGHLTAPAVFGPTASLVQQYLPAYTLAAALVSTGFSLTTLLPTQRFYVHASSLFIAAAALAFLVSQRHSSVGDIAMAVPISSVVYLLIVLLTWKLTNVLNWTFRNTVDLLRVFSPIAEDRQPNAQRVLIFNWRDTRHIQAGGAEIFIHQIARRWVRDGLQVTIFCGNDGHSPHFEIMDGVRIYRRGGFYTVYLWAAIYYLLRFRGKFDHLIDASNGIPFFTPLYAKLPKTLIIHHVHRAVFATSLPRYLENIAVLVEKNLMPKLYRSVPVVTISASSKQEIVKLGFNSEHLINVVNPGVDHPAWPTAPKSDFPLFVYLGRVKKYKQIDVAIRAFGQVQAQFPQSRLLIAGCGDYRHQLEILASGLGLKPSVKFLGPVTEIQKWQLLHQAWAVLQPSSAEGWGITVIEANAAGTPVIASDIPGLRDSVLDQQTGILVPSGSVPDLAKAMKKIISSQNFRFRLGKNAFIWSQRFDWDISAQKFKSLITATPQLKSKKLIYQTVRVR